MNIESIFEIITDALASVKYREEPLNAFEQCFAQWDDVEYLEDFFESHKKKLSGIFWGLTVEKAIESVLDDAQQFKEDILYYAEQGKISDEDQLDDHIFIPLSKGDHSARRVHSKAYGADGRPSMLRMYAIRLGPNHYIVTGGAIKLTKKMDDCDHTRLELMKLRLVSDYLKSLGIDDEEDYGYLEFSTT